MTAGRPPAGELDALRGALRSRHPLLRAGAEATIKAALTAKSWNQAARDLGINPRSFEQFRRDFPEIDQWREDILK